jgi:F-type H+-transporting ATPase subunit b
MLHFETADALIGGIELSVNGQRVAWSINAYLGSLEADVGQLLDDASAPASNDPASGAEPT